MGVDQCKLIELPSVEDPQGNLVFAEGDRHVPFSIARAYHVYGVPTGAKRGGHAHREIEQLVVCLSGGFVVAVDDGVRRNSFALGDPRVGLHLPPLVWHDLTDFAAESTYYVLSSGLYDESEYVRSYEEFRHLVADPLPGS